MMLILCTYYFMVYGMVPYHIITLVSFSFRLADPGLMFVSESSSLRKGAFIIAGGGVYVTRAYFTYVAVLGLQATNTAVVAEDINVFTACTISFQFSLGIQHFPDSISRQRG